MSSIPHLSAEELSRLPADGGERYNRLIFEKSPYLLQHADNPVGWYPWGDEALALAQREDRPLFVSIGYSTCHWCHVMAAESFADPQVAAVLNRLFVPVKVDREERPDLDNTYMAACQLLTGQGGWPLNVILTPDCRPFFAATYLPRQPRPGMTGIIPLLEQVARFWRERRQQLEETAGELTQALLELESAPAGSPLGPHPLQQAIPLYAREFDPVHGGFGPPPKFPAPHNLSLLLRLHHRFGDGEARDMALVTLTAMRLGGLTDQLGGGIHRYSVDARWRVPHFEKMLYDQALAALAYLDAWQASADPFFADAATDILDYVLRDLRLPDGGVACGEDADSEGREGAFYLWTPAQVRQVLGAEEGERVCRLLGISEAGDLEGASVPHLPRRPAVLAGEWGWSAERMGEQAAGWRRALLTARGQRPRPHRDDKVLTGWNGLAVAALARGGALLQRPDWLAAARCAIHFIDRTLVRHDGRLLRRWCEGEAAIPGFLEDHTYLAWGLLELHQADFDPGWLRRAEEVAEQVERLFSDGAGGYYDSGSDGESPLLRGRSSFDGAQPSAGAVLAAVWPRLGRLTDRPELCRRGEQLLAGTMPQIERLPTAHAHWLTALDFLLAEDEQLTINGTAGAEVETLLQTARHNFHPRLLLQRQPQGAAAAHLCRGHRCLPPVATADELEQRLREG